MSNVADLNSRRKDPHMQGPAACLQCKHTWQAVAPVGTTGMECPKCGVFKGYFLQLIGPEDGLERCQCETCGSQLWAIMPLGALCAGCGASLSWEDLLGGKDKQ